MICEENTTQAYPWKLAKFSVRKDMNSWQCMLKKGVMNVPIFVPKFNTSVHHISSWKHVEP
jgi:hypothetical protein